MTADPWSKFETHARQLQALGGLDNLSHWDSETFMPRKAAEARGAQQAALRAVMHEKLTGPRLGELLEQLDLSRLDARQADLVRVVRRDRDRERNVPERLVVELATAQARAVEAWKEARRTDTFELLRPHLEQLVKLRCEEADARGHGGERYDPLLDKNEPGLSCARLTPILGRLRDGLVPLVQALSARPPPDDAFLSMDAWDVDAQYAFSLELLAAMGFDLDAGRLDRSVHPFCCGLSPTDVRLTTRLFRNDGSNGLFSALHEAGHGLYEQGLAADGTPLSTAASMGLHESQSRLWENVIGRSRPFWSHFLPRLAARFPEPMRGVSVDRWLASINRVQPSLIRVDADEVTYNLHILVRFELELALIHGDLSVRDLPGAWNERYERVLGVRPPTDADGVLQDIHWSLGEFGYFPTYAVGNMYAASLTRAAERALPTLWQEVARGELSGLRGWLKTNVHEVGRAKDAEEIVRDVTGTGLTETDLLAYLRAKYEA